MPVDFDIEMLFTMRTLVIAGIWFAAGLAVSWNRPLSVSGIVPMVVSAIPVMTGFSDLGIAHGIVIPIACSLAGGHAALAINPVRSTGAAARRAATAARSEAMRVQAELLQIADSFADREPSREDAVVLRIQLANRRARLRDATRTLSRAS